MLCMNRATHPMNTLELAKAIACEYVPSQIGRPSAIGDTTKVQILLSELVAGVHLEPAACLAGLSSATVKNWLKRGESEPDSPESRPYGLFFRAVREAQASVEARISRNVIKASETPAFWTAGITYLERTAPERWARPSDRVERGVSAIEVHVHGIGSNDVSIGVATDVPRYAPQVVENPSNTQQLSSDHLLQRQVHAVDSTYPQAQELSTGVSSTQSGGGDMHRGAPARSAGPTTHAPQNLQRTKSSSLRTSHHGQSSESSGAATSTSGGTSNAGDVMSTEITSTKEKKKRLTQAELMAINPAAARRAAILHAQGKRDRRKKVRAKRLADALRYEAGRTTKQLQKEAKKAEANLPDEL